MLSAARRAVRRVRDEEDGQILILFVVMFTVILAMAAFAVDQGLWFGRRRLVQGAADSSARAGAIAFFGNAFEPCEHAARTAADNAIDIPNPDWCNDDPNATETEFRETSYAPVPGSPLRTCVQAQIDTEVRALFSGSFGIDEINVGASATACAGTALDVRASGGNGPQGVPIVLAPSSNGPAADRDCFDSNHLVPGVECVIWASMDNPDGNRLVWLDRGGCDGPINGSAVETRDKIWQGVEWTCRLGDSVGTEYTTLVASMYFDQQDIREAFLRRLGWDGPNTTCDKGPDSTSFGATFGRGDGLPIPADPPMPFPGGKDPADAIYVQNDCFNNPRLIMMPFTTEAATSSGDKVIAGFAVVYVTGCYPSNSPMHAVWEPETETNPCYDRPSDTGWPGAEPDRPADRNCNPALYTPSDFCKYEVRGVPVRVFLAQAQAGRIGDMTGVDRYDFPLVIQTVE